MATTVCLIRSNPPLFYLANTLAARSPLALVIVEARPPRFLTRLSRRLRPAADVPRDIDPARLPRRDVRAAQARLYDRYFADRWRYLDPVVPLMVTRDINAPAVRERVAALAPDVIVDHGTSIVGGELIAAAPLTLNVHWGLSPYYRGTHCTEWALLNWDPYNIGVTVHRLTREIDGGGVLAQSRATVAPDDTVESINMQLTHLGTQLVVSALDRLDRGEQLQFREQDHGRGYLTLNRQWSRFAARHVRHLERAGGIAQMLKRPARRERLPIVEMK